MPSSRGCGGDSRDGVGAVRSLPWLTGLCALVVLNTALAIPPAAIRYRSDLTREAHAVAGLNAPIPMYAAQIEQESAWRPGITAWDNGRGLAQFMDATSMTITALYPDLGKSDPYNPIWAMRALVRYDTWLVARAKGHDPCNARAAALHSYNAGLGYTQYQQRHSPKPDQWFDVTEHVATKQSAKNFEYSRMYPRWILQKRQPGYKMWGSYTCQGVL